jgi:hypothetical protein
MDNMMVEGIDYCYKHALRHYGKKRVFEAENNKELKYTLSIIVAKLQGLVGKK